MAKATRDTININKRIMVTANSITKDGKRRASLNVKTKHLIQYGIIAIDSLIHRQIETLKWLDERLFCVSMRLG